MNIAPIVNRINGMHDVERGANALGLHCRSYRKLGQPDDGKTSPIQRFSDWAEHVTSLHDPEINRAVLEMLTPILNNMGMMVLNESRLRDLRKIMAEIAPGDHRLDEATPMCPRCDSPLQYVPQAGGWYCHECKGR